MNNNGIPVDVISFAGGAGPVPRRVGPHGVVAGNAQVAWLSRILCVVVAHVVGFSRMVGGAREPW